MLGCQDAGVAGPDLVGLDEAAKDFGKLLGAGTLGDNVGPRLFVARGGGPAGGFEEGADVGVADLAIGHGAGAPARGEVFVDGMVRGCLFEFVHAGVNLVTSRYSETSG